MAIGVTLALIISSKPIDSRRILLLGIDLVSIDVPVGLMALRKSELEHGEYNIRRARGQRVMRIVIDQGLDYSWVDYASTYYCVNGVEGVTNLKGGFRKVLLHLPPGGDDYRFYFEFRENDATAKAIMKTFQMKDNNRPC